MEEKSSNFILDAIDADLAANPGMKVHTFKQEYNHGRDKQEFY